MIYLECNTKFYIIELFALSDNLATVTASWGKIGYPPKKTRYSKFTGTHANALNYLYKLLNHKKRRGYKQKDQTS